MYKGCIKSAIVSKTMISEFTVTPFQRKALAVTTALAVVFGAYFLYGYFQLIVLALIVAFSFNWLYQWLLKRLHSKSAASALTLLATFFAVIIPLIVVLYVTVNEVAHLVDSVKGINVRETERTIIVQINNILNSLSIPFQLTPDWLKEALTKALQTFGAGLLNTLTSTLGNFFNIFSSAIIYIFIFLSVLLNQEKLLSLIRRLNPLGEGIGELYMSRTAAMTKAMVKGQFIIAILQGLTDAGLLYFAGLHNLFFFFLVLLTALSVVPLGGGVVAIPLGIAMMFMGNFWGGLLVVAGHIIIVTNIDNVLRPKLVPRQARLDSALALLSVFSGIKFFGFLGIVIGPVIMILIVSTIQVYLEVFHNLVEVKIENNTLKKKKFHEIVLFWKKPTIVDSGITSHTIE